MLVGHIGVALGAKRLAPKASVGTLMLASLLLKERGTGVLMQASGAL